jgi:hypothetical protein
LSAIANLSVNNFVFRDPLSEYERPQPKIEARRKLVAYRVGGTAQSDARDGRHGLAPHAVAQEE